MASATALAPGRAQGATMLSRVAHSLYWMSRYIERAENVARLVDVNLQLLADFQDVDEDAGRRHWGSILASTGDRDLFDSLHPALDSQTATDFLAFDRSHPGSILSCVFAARENARMIRDQISSEMWQAINELYLYLRERSAAEVWAAGPSEFFQHIKLSSHLFRGLTEATYSRNEGWEFIQFGKFLERADKTTRILDVKYHVLLPNAGEVGGAIDTVQWQAVLRSASALEAYRRFYVREILPWKAAEFLIFSDSFPRSLHYCAIQIDDSLRRILGETGARPRTAAGRSSRRLLADLESLSIDEVLRGGLHEFLLATQKSLEGIGSEVVQTTMFYPVDPGPGQQQEQQQQ